MLPVVKDKNPEGVRCWICDLTVSEQLLFDCYVDAEMQHVDCTRSSSNDGTICCYSERSSPHVTERTQDSSAAAISVMEKRKSCWTTLMDWDRTGKRLPNVWTWLVHSGGVSTTWLLIALVRL